MWAYRSANYLVKHQNESNEKRRVYYYGFQVIFGELMKLIILIIASLLLGTLGATMITALIFAFLRRTAGGYHMDTYGKCMTVTLGLFLFSGVIAQYTYQGWSVVHILILIMTTFIVSLFVIIKWAPADTPNKPITNPEKIRKFKMQSIIIIVFWLIFMLFMSYYKQHILIIAACLGVLLESFTIAPAGYRFFNWISGLPKKGAVSKQG